MSEQWTYEDASLGGFEVRELDPIRRRNDPGRLIGFGLDLADGRIARFAVDPATARRLATVLLEFLDARDNPPPAVAGR